ncbi:NADPH-dependent F420 reductase [Bradyrhizobium ottawaense]|uniref:NADPH-dependent F420 reductase n=1 Tax=Bradyrhizobium ottawaense TaxID=931866 RepID=UPI00384F6D86
MNGRVDSKRSVAVLGGTGAEGSGLALRWAAAGYSVTIGSRDESRALQAASDLNTRLPDCAPKIKAATNRVAAAGSELVVMTVPWSAQASTADDIIDELQGKILVDVTVPLSRPRVDRVHIPEAGSAVAQLQKRVGTGVRVVAAFQNVSAHHLKRIDEKVDCDVLVCGDSREAREEVIRLASDIGLRGIHAGELCNAAAVEAMTSVLIAINKAYRVAGSGIKITGLQ